MNMEFLNDLDNYLKIKQYRLVNSVLVYENDELIFERYYNKGGENKTSPIMSVWKSLLSLTMGICMDKGLIQSVDEPIGHYLPQFNMNIHMFHKFITIRHLLTMSSGIYFNPGIHYHCPMLEQMRRSSDWISHIAEVQTTDYPGTKFVYKEWDVILLSALIGKACGGTAWDIAGDHLYKPLGIRANQWLMPKSGINYNIDKDEYDELTARDMAKIGLLTLHGGKWNGQRIVSDEYIKSAVSPPSANGGYGFLWWLSGYGWHGRGFGGQELNVYPDKNIVAVVQATVTPSSKSYGDICENICL
jgi:CubicO group peptidase (beta-lactamase class C family)